MGPMFLQRERTEGKTYYSEIMKKKPKMEMSDFEYYCNPEYVLMPWDDKTTIIVSEDGNKSQAYSRWDLIKRLLNKEITSVESLIDTIKAYNVVFNKNGEQIKPKWNCPVLRQYFSQLDEFERKNFFKENGVLSTIRKLSLDLETLVPKLKVLKSGFNCSIKLHQLQIASILANAFFCTFSRGKADCPLINFNNNHCCEKRAENFLDEFILLYEGEPSSVFKYYLEKIKCLLHYFERIHQEQPTGFLSFHRLNISDHKFPRWDKTNSGLCSLKVNANGRIEDQFGFLQMDFANKYVGGGVLGRGCVQEEIRFLICPDLIAARLFTECLADNESLFVAGAERFCQYRGYASTFEFAGDYEDRTPFDENGHRKTYLIILDALYFNHSSEQYRESKILRELKKAYVGFKPIQGFNVLPLATGNWGCGAFRGDPQLKSLLQLMASSEAGRDVLYLTFGNALLKTQLEDIYFALKQNSVNVGTLYHIIRLYNRERKNRQTVFEFVLSWINRLEKGMFPAKPSTSLSKETSEKKSHSAEGTRVKRQHSKEEVTDGNFLEMDVDFKALDKEVQNRFPEYSQKPSAKSITSLKHTPSSPSNRVAPVKSGVIQEGASLLDILSYENEMACSSSSSGGREKRSYDSEKRTRDSPSLFSEDELGNSEKSHSPGQETENSGLESENKTQYKKMVQSKITDCFFKK